MPIIVIGLVSQVAIGLIGCGQQDLRPQDRQLDPGDPDRGAVRHRHRLHPVLPVPLPRTAARAARRAGPRSRTRVERAGEAIASAGGAVIVAFMALVLSSLGIFRSIGPALAIAVAVTLLAALTLVPAVVSLLGTRRSSGRRRTCRVEPEAARFAAVGRSLGRHPVRYAAGLRAACSPCWRSSPSASTPPSTSATPAPRERRVRGRPAARSQKGLPAGATDPTTVLLHSTDGQPLDPGRAHGVRRGRSGRRDGVGAGRARPCSATDEHRGLVQRRASRRTRPPTQAIADVKGPIRDAAHEAAPDGTEALVGGTTSVFVDFQTAMNRDYRWSSRSPRIVIMLILALLLRSLVAPLYLMASVGLGFARHPRRGRDACSSTSWARTGLIFLLPIYIYLFVVALGTDYNILMIARLREEARDGLDAARRGRRGGQARRPDRRGGRPDPGRHVRVPDAGRQRPAHRDGLLDLLRHLRRRRS